MAGLLLGQHLGLLQYLVDKVLQLTIHTLDHPAPIPRFHNKHYEVQGNPSSVFTGREEILGQLKRNCLPAECSNAQYQQQEQHSQKRFILHGLGGCGKTQLCLKFAELYREKYWGIFWIDASSEENIQRGFLNISKTCGLEDDVRAVKIWLSNVPDSWMLILDNADDPDLDLSPHFPLGNRGTILITSRNPDCRIHATAGVCELGRMEEEEAITLLLKTAGHEDLSDEAAREIAKSVVAILGCLALAIDQAGAVIRQGLYTMEEYRKVYSRRWKELLNRKSVQHGGDYVHTVYTTWDISLQMIANKGGEAARDAIELLQVFSFFHYNGISEEIFRRAWENLKLGRHSEWMRSNQLSLVRQESATWDAGRLRTGLSLLSSFSLISRDENGFVSIHPLVHKWARDYLNSSDEERTWTISACSIAVSISWAFQTADYRFRKHLVPHIDSCLHTYEDGVFHIRQVSEECLSMAQLFALAYGEAGRQRETLQLLETVVAAHRRALGEEHPDTLGSMHDLAISYSEAGRWQEALQLLEKVVAAHRRTLGEEHPDTLGSMHDLAISYSEAGRRQEALQLRETVVAARKRTLGEEHPDTLMSIHDLAISYSEAGRRQEALQLLETVVAARKRTLGEEHPDTLLSIQNLTAFEYAD
ncbi:hypothetical protein OIDMADRAFT_36187 [Oidiodendron maius Zn]|uniref:Uncharacterized protein n=1 Tax=Oidiodendron maius (strain Zn) TaxID=913774 RepID=A0A0C3CTC5_OIDMZ|nr:hypothetical protein OIDMADRAFT_36187 [Oidiodendron maius Zn]